MVRDGGGGGGKAAADADVAAVAGPQYWLAGWLLVAVAREYHSKTGHSCGIITLGGVQCRCTCTLARRINMVIAGLFMLLPSGWLLDRLWVYGGFGARQHQDHHHLHSRFRWAPNSQQKKKNRMSISSRLKTIVWKSVEL